MKLGKHIPHQLLNLIRARPAPRKTQQISEKEIPSSTNKWTNKCNNTCRSAPTSLGRANPIFPFPAICLLCILYIRDFSVAVISPQNSFVCWGSGRKQISKFRSTFSWAAQLCGFQAIPIGNVSLIQQDFMNFCNKCCLTAFALNFFSGGGSEVHRRRH